MVVDSDQFQQELRAEEQLEQAMHGLIGQPARVLQAKDNRHVAFPPIVGALLILLFIAEHMPGGMIGQLELDFQQERVHLSRVL